MLSRQVRADRFAADYLAAYRRHAAAFAGLILLGGACGLTTGVRQGAEYASTAAVLVTPTGVTDPNPGRNRAPAVVDLDTEVQLARSPAVISAASSAISISPARLRQRLTLSVPPNSRVLRFRFTGSTPDDTARGANAAADAYLAQRRETAETVLANRFSRIADQADDLAKDLRTAADQLDDPDADAGDLLYAQSQVQVLTRQLGSAGQRLQEARLTVVTPGRTIAAAQPPRSASGPGLARRALEGSMLGLLAASAATFLLGRRRRRVRGLVDLGALVPAGAVAAGDDDRLIGHRPEDLAANLIRMLPRGGIVSVFGIGGQPSLPACFAITRSMRRSRYQAVTLIWPREAMTERGPVERAGTAEFLLAPGDGLGDLVTEIDEVPILPAGLDIRRADTATGRKQLRQALERVRAEVEYAFVQLSGNRPQTTPVAQASDAVILVARDHVTDAAEIRRAIARVGPERVIGVHLRPAPGAGALRPFRRRSPADRVPADQVPVSTAGP